MEARLILYENYRKIDSSFTGYLYHDFLFNNYAYHALCDSIEELARISPADGTLLRQIHRIYSDILYFFCENEEGIHFDDQSMKEYEKRWKEEWEMDLSKMSCLTLVMETLNPLEGAVDRYIETFGDGA